LTIQISCPSPSPSPSSDLEYGRQDTIGTRTRTRTRTRKKFSLRLPASALYLLQLPPSYVKVKEKPPSHMFSTLLLKMVPLYLNILLGFLAGKLLSIPRDIIARFMFYMINPIILFNGVIHTQINGSILSLPLFVLFLSSLLCILFYYISKKIWDDSTVGLMAFNAGSGNTGYFGLPLAILLFDNQGEGVYLMAILGVTLYENTIGYYICAKSKYTSSECFEKIFKLPSLYALGLALLVNYLQLPIPGVFTDFMCHIKGTYTVLGMMIVGLGIANLHHFKIDGKFIGITFFAKFFVWPLIILSLVILDQTCFQIYNSDIYQALILLSIVPLGVNGVILASLLQAQPEKAAAAVLLSILFALFYIPLMIIYFINQNPQLFEPFLCT
jgi:predicted permease